MSQRWAREGDGAWATAAALGPDSLSVGAAAIVIAAAMKGPGGPEFKVAVMMREAAAVGASVEAECETEDGRIMRLAAASGESERLTARGKDGRVKRSDL